MEKRVYSRLTKYIDKQNIFVKLSIRIQKGYSTCMALSILIDKIKSATDKGEHIIGIVLDFAEAFDTLNHNILLKKLNHYGIRGTVLQWFQSYISSRTQTVRISETNSSL